MGSYTGTQGWIGADMVTQRIITTASLLVKADYRYLNTS